jgi:hypothetical protein
MEGDQGGGMGVVGSVIYIAFIVLMIASIWKVYAKAGQPGWACIIPIYNIIVLLKIVGKPWWWLFGLLIPFVNFVVLIIVAIQLAKAFGKGVGFAIGMVFLPFIFYPMLGFGGATYTAPPLSI